MLSTKQEHVLVLFIAEIFRHRERGKRHAQTRAGGLVHLAVHETNLGAGLNDRQAVFAQNRMALGIFFTLMTLASIISVVVKIVASARAFTDTGEPI